MTDSSMILEADSSACLSLPADSAFLGGTRHLELYQDIQETQSVRNSAESDYSGSAVIDILSMTFLIIGIAWLRKYMNIIPSLVGCIIRWKENINLEDSTKLCLTRNSIYILMLIPFCLIMDKFKVYSPDFLSDTSDFYRFLFTCCIFLIYLSTRKLLHKFIRFGKISEKIFATAANSFRTYFVVLVTISLASTGVIELADFSDTIGNKIITYEILAIYGLFLFRKTQIFINYCSLISGILYLCALEFLPTGILVATAIVL